MSKEPDWLEKEVLEIINDLRGARFISMLAGYGDYELPAFIVSTLEQLMARAGVEVPPEEEEEDE